MRLLTTTTKKLLLTGAFALLGALGFALFSAFALRALDTGGVGPLAILGFLLFAPFGWPLLLGLRFGASPVALVGIVTLNVAYLYLLACVVLWLCEKASQKRRRR